MQVRDNRRKFNIYQEKFNKKKNQENHELQKKEEKKEMFSDYYLEILLCDVIYLEKRM